MPDGMLNPDLPRYLQEARGRTRLIGLIIADITNPYSVNVLSGIEAACREKGFTPLVCNTNNEVDQERHSLKRIGLHMAPTGYGRKADNMPCLPSLRGQGPRGLRSAANCSTALSYRHYLRWGATSNNWAAGVRRPVYA